MLRIVGRKVDVITSECVKGFCEEKKTFFPVNLQFKQEIMGPNC